MNEYLKEYIDLKNNFSAQDGDKASVLSLYQFSDRLSLIEEKEAKEVLVDVYQQLGLMESAFKVFSDICDRADRKQIKKLVNLQNSAQNHGDSYALPRPLTDAEEASRRERLKDLPRFKYHPDPLSTGSFEEGEEKSVLAVVIRARSTIRHFHIALKMWSIFVLHVYQMEKLQ